MFKENELMTQKSELPKDRLSPEHMQLQIKSNLNKVVEEYASKKTTELSGEDYAKALQQIEILEKMAKKFANNDLDTYIEQKLIELKSYKDLSSQSKLKNMGQIKRIIRPGIGTHR